MARLYRRTTLRLSRWDYARGAYFVTLRIRDRQLVLRDIEGLTDAGAIVAETWEWIERQYPHVALDEWCAMPDHFHGIILLVNVRAGDRERWTCRGASRTSAQLSQGASRSAPTASTRGDGLETMVGRPKCLGRLIGAFKTKSTNQVNRLRGTPAAILWQRNYYEHIIRDAADMNRIRQYIRSNVSEYESPIGGNRKEAASGNGAGVAVECAPREVP